MNIVEYKQKYKISKRTIVKWLNDGYIPGVKFKNNEWVIPDNARLPYRCSKHIMKPESIYKSFVKAYSQGKSITPVMYNMTTQKFNLFNKRLLDKGLIEKELLDNIIYYNATEKGEEYISFSNNKLAKFFKELFGIAIYNSTKAFLDSNK